MRPCHPSIRTALCLSVLAFPTAALVAEEPTRFAADRPVDCLHIKLDLNVDVESRHVDATATIDLTALRPVTTIRLDANELEVHGVKLARDGAALRDVRHLNDGSQLDVLLEKPLAAGEKATLVIDYTVDNPSTGLHFFGPSENEPDVPYVVWSQGESTFNSYWFPCFDNPNERQTTELVVTTSSDYAVSSNGRLLSKDENPRAGTVTYHWLQAQPHVAYLVSMIVGEFSITRETWRGKPVEYWVHPRYEERVSRSFRNTTRMLDFFSNSIGVEYPWDRYAQICCEGFGGGMENTSATTLGNRTLHDARSFLDSDADGLIAHEMAHQWWGDLLTCRDWAHLWLNEGFASYFEALWDEYDLGPDEFAYNMNRKARSARRGGRDRPIVDRAYSHSRAMFDSRAYPKGAWVLHMVRRRLGDELFWQVLNAYATGHAYQTVETVDLRKTIEQVTGRSFERFFYDWTERPGHPEVNVSYKWLSDDKLAKVSIKQTQKEAVFHFPLTIEFRFDGARSPLRFEREISEREVTFYYPLPAAPAMVRVDPEQSVLMELEQRMGSDLWKTQLLEDPSALGRLRAAEHFRESTSDADRKLLASALESERFWGVQREIAGALAESGGEIARDALIAGLKFEDHKARRACVEQLDSFHGDETVLDAVRPLVVNGDPSYYVEAAAIETYAALEPADGLRVLESVLGRDSRGEIIRSAALTGLGRLSDPQVIPLLCEWTRPDKPRRARPAAIRAVARVTTNVYLDEQATEPIVEALTAALNDSGYRVRWSAASALGSLSEPAWARSALGTLRAVAANDPRERLRRTAERTIEAIEKGEPAQVQVDELRDELKEILEKNEEMEDRLERLESREPAEKAEVEGPSAAP
ncbi:MAG: M1 family aminopeptidase [Planctomycetota bacterium]